MTEPLTHRPFMALQPDPRGRRRVVTLVPPHVAPDPDRSRVEALTAVQRRRLARQHPNIDKRLDETPPTPSASSPSSASAPPTSSPSTPSPEPSEEAPVAAKKKRRGRRVIDDATKAKAVARVLAKRPGETVESIAGEFDVSRSSLDNWVAKRARAPIVGIAEQVSFEARARDITDGAALLAALNQYIDTRIERGVKAALAALLKGGVG
jgi:transposase-like protein